MRLPGSTTVTVAAVAVVSAALAIYIGLTSSGEGGDPGDGKSLLQGVPPEALANAGITLKAPPPDFVPKIGQQEIEASRVSGASSLGFDLPIREIALAHVSDNSRVPPINRVLWVVSLDVSGARMPNLGPGGPGLPDYFPYLYSLVFVDPDTGAFVYSVEAARSAPSPGEAQQ